MFWASMVTEIVLIRYHQADFTKLESEGSKISIGDGDDDSNELAIVILGFYRLSSYFNLGDFMYIYPFYILLLRTNLFWDTVYYDKISKVFDSKPNLKEDDQVELE